RYGDPCDQRGRAHEDDEEPPGREGSFHYFQRRPLRWFYTTGLWFSKKNTILYITLTGLYRSRLYYMLVLVALRPPPWANSESDPYCHPPLSLTQCIRYVNKRTWWIAQLTKRSVSSDFRPAVTDTSSRCKTWVFAQSFGMVTCLFAANGLLALRLMALYRRKKLLVWFITAFYLSSYITTFGLLVHTMTIYHDSIHYSEIVKSCQAAAHSPTISAVFYAPAAFETFVFGMTAYSAMKDAQVITGKSAPFLVVLYRDGFISFFVMVALRIWNCWIYMTQPVSSYAMGTPFMWAANAVLTTRIYINLVWLAKKPLCTVSEYPGHAGFQEVRASINFRMPPTTFNSRTGYLSSTGRGLEMTPSKLRHHDRDDGRWP
ncbi:hypothetical protein FRC17_002989, partial [Serendipita sp. 399]